jgi:hypothetical protein
VCGLDYSKSHVKRFAAFRICGGLTETLNHEFAALCELRDLSCILVKLCHSALILLQACLVTLYNHGTEPDLLAKSKN